MFQNINFRYTDAQEEKHYSPEIIEKTFVDLGNILEKIKRPEKFIVSGPKGAGKSALASKLQMESEHSWNLFVNSDNLEQFDFRLLAKSTSEKACGLNSTVNVWQLLLLIRFVPLFLNDHAVADGNDSLRKLNLGLERIGLETSDSLINIVEYTSSKGVFSKLKGLAGEVGFNIGSNEKCNIKQPAEIVNTIKYVLREIRGVELKKYYLILDGLDYTIRYGIDNAHYLADLISASRLLNLYFSNLKIDAKIILLLRDEILTAIPDPNLAKRINDNGIPLKWYDNSRDPFRTSLLEVIQKRANLVGITGNISDIWSQWFDSDVEQKELKLILDNTRYLPRDLISFFRELQKIKTTPPFSREDILAALANYSDWFFSELNDSLVGIIDEDIRVNLPSILSSVGKKFSIDDFNNAKEKICPTSKSSSESILRELFNTSWIGNMWDDNGQFRYAWRHRKKNAVFNSNFSICLHKGLYKTLNLV